MDVPSDFRLPAGLLAGVFALSLVGVLPPACLSHLGSGQQVVAQEPPANSKQVVEETFESGDLSDQWHINSGQWEVTDGVLRAKEIASDNHAAAARRRVETENAVYKLRFRILEGGKAFHFGFDPSANELDKKGHLFSVIVTPESWKILKHVDKARPQESPNETLAQQQTEFNVGQWYSMRVTTWQSFVSASIEGKKVLKVSDPTFSVKKPTLVFRCSGEGVEIDDIRVWRQRP